MFFLILIILIITFILFSNITLCITKVDFIYYVKLKVNGITFLDKKINTNEKGKKPKDIKSIYRKINEIKSSFTKIFKLLRYIIKRSNIKTLKFDIYLSNDDYVKGGYYIAILNMVHYMIKNICNNIEVKCSYKSQKEQFKFNFDINFSARLYNNIINFIKLAIIIIRVSKKGKMENGTTSNRKFNGNSNVIYRKYDRC